MISQFDAEQLIEELRKVYPNTMVMTDEDAFTRGAKVGHQEIIEYIKNKYIEVEDNESN